MNYELTGRVKLLQEVQTFGSGFTKREIVVVVEHGKYPQEINLEFVQDKVELLSELTAGDEVTVTFDIRGREYNDRYFNSLVGWKVAVVGGGSRTGSPSSAPAAGGGSDEYEDDIPF